LLSGLVVSTCGVARAVAAEDTTPEQPRSITVVGSATVDAAPDRVRITFDVETRAATAEAVASKNAKKSQAVLAALKSLVKPPGRVTTFGYRLNPEYSYGEHGGARRRVLTGYAAVNRLRVVSDDLAGAGALIDRATGAGASGAGSVSFFRDDLTTARRQALLEAGQRARGEAEAIAESLGVTLGEVLSASSASSSSIPPRPRVMAMREATASAPKTPLEAGDIAVSMQVTVVFAIH